VLCCVCPRSGDGSTVTAADLALEGDADAFKLGRALKTGPPRLDSTAVAGYFTSCRCLCRSVDLRNRSIETCSFGHLLLQVCCVTPTRCEFRRDRQHSLSLDGCLKSDTVVGTSSAFLVLVRLHVSCFLQISVAETETIQALYRTVTAQLGPIGVDAILSWNCFPLSPNDGRELGQVGIHHRSMIECTLTLRGGMKGTAESTADSARRSAREKGRQFKFKVFGLETLVSTRPMRSLTSPLPDPPTALHRRSIASTWPRSVEPDQGTRAKVCNCTDVGGWWE
jgi:hypothetical protein